MNTQTQAQKLRRLVWFGSAFSIVIILIAAAASWLLYQQTIKLLTENLRERLLTVSITTATAISPVDLEALHTEADAKKPEWARVVNELNRSKYANSGIVYMYMFRKMANNPNEMEYIADADSIDPYANTDANPNNDVDVNRDGKIEPDGPDKLQWPGQPYPEAVDIPEAFQAYDGPLTVKDLYTDDYGTVLTGYAPIRNASGTVVAILATDIKADDFFTITQATLYPFLLFIAFLVVVISLLALTLIYIWERRAENLAELDRLKSEFLSVATHQLRAPITAIRGYAANMIDGTYGAIPPYLVDPLSVIQESSRLMVNSIEDYLNISRIEQGRMKYEKSKFDLAELSQKVVNEFQAVAKQKSIAFVYGGGEAAMVNADIGKIKQVLTNLIDNAIKYTKQGSVTVSVAKAPTGVRVTVADTGVGISKEDIPKLFSKFTRARDANKVNTTGTGLGLYVVKQLVEGNGGKTWIESAGSGKGSHFIVELPAA
jgi:signal transduction histidine kinase